MRCIPKSWPLALAMLLTSLPAAAQAIGGQPTQPQLIEAPPTFGSCQPALTTVNNLHVDSQGATFNLTNVMGPQADEAVTFDVVANGRRRYFWAAINLPPGVVAPASVRFLAEVSSITIGTCHFHPVGIVDGDTPVLSFSVIAPPDGP